MPMTITWKNSDPTKKSIGILPFLSGYKTYIVVLVACGYCAYCKYSGTTPDPTILTILGFGSIAALRSAAEAIVAQLISAGISPAPKP